METSEEIKKARILSFKYAFNGIIGAAATEPNFKFHLVAAVFVFLAGFYFNVSKAEWIIIIILTGLVLTLELTNTAIEAVVNSFTDKAHPGAKLAKDISAGAVLISAVTAAIVGLIIFLPYIF